MEYHVFNSRWSTILVITFYWNYLLCKLDMWDLVPSYNFWPFLMWLLTLFSVNISVVLLGPRRWIVAAALGNILLNAVRLTLVALLLIKWNEDSWGKKYFREKYLHIPNGMLISKISKTICRKKNKGSMDVFAKSKNKHILCSVYFSGYH